MPPRRTYLLAPLLLMLWSVVPGSRPANAQPLLPLVVIMAASAGISNIDTGSLRRAFRGYPTDLQGKRLVPFNQVVGAADRVRFDQAVVGLSPDQVGKFWVDQRIRQVSLPPRIIPSSDLLLRVVASLSGAISYVASAPDRLPPEIRVLTVDGKPPGTSGYPLAGF